MILFEQFAFLLLLPALVPLIFISHFWRRRGGRILISYKIYRQHTYFKFNRLWQLLAVFAHLLLWASLGLMIVALANPGFVERHHILLQDGSAIMIVMDVSPSMAAHDVGQAQSRFDIARDSIERFLNQRDGNPVGLITFGREAAIRIPLTKDYEFFRTRLEDVWLLEHGDGTNIGRALALAALQLERSKAEHKIIILITDGANNIGELNPEDAIALLQSLGIQAFTVGVGSAGRLRISVWDKREQQLLSGFVDDAYDEDLLKAIALETNGYFFKSDSAGAFDAMFNTVEQQYTKDGLTRTSVTTSSTKFQLLAWALMTMMSSIIIRYVLLREVF